MREHNFWDDYAKAMEDNIEGNQQISREITQFLAAKWHEARRAIAEELSEFRQPRNLPPL
jgi:hypothetical protein